MIVNYPKLDACGVSVVDQVADTREALSAAGKVLTKWRRKGARK